MESTGIKAFFKRKNINFTLRTYFIDAMGAMAFGLFASLLIGTIFATLGEKSGIQVFNTIAQYAKGATGAAYPSPMPSKRLSWYFCPPPP